MRVFLIFSMVIMFASLTTLVHADIIEDIEDLDKKPKDSPKPEPEEPLVPLPPSGSSKKDAGISGESQGGESPAKAKAKPGANKRDESAAKFPIKLKSDGRSTYTRNGGVMMLRKNVVITQNQLRLQADQAKVLLDQTNKDEMVKRVEINGHVKVSKFSEDPSEQIIGHGNRAVFDNKEQTVKLIGNARLFKGGHLIRGKQIIYDVETGLISVDQAQGVVQPQEAE